VIGQLRCFPLESALPSYPGTRPSHLATGLMARPRRADRGRSGGCRGLEPLAARH
jgi:hypothetical protein